MIKVSNLTVKAEDGTVLLENISFQLAKGECLGISGRSGAGKSTILKTLMGTLQGAHMVCGRVMVDKHSLVGIKAKDHRKLCGKVIGFIPQQPMGAFDGRLVLGRQIQEILRTHLGQGDFYKEIEEAFWRVNLRDVDRILKSYPSQLSGGMLQRVIVALLLILKPAYILADEPTSALDEENKRILIESLKSQSHMGILMVSHDQEVLQSLCTRIMFIADGKEVEGRFEASNSRKGVGEWVWKALD